MFNMEFDVLMFHIYEYFDEFTLGFDYICGGFFVLNLLTVL